MLVGMGLVKKQSWFLIQDTVDSNDRRGLNNSKRIYLWNIFGSYECLERIQAGIH